MTMSVRETSKRELRQPQLTRGLAMRLAATEYDRFHDQLRSLAEADWSRPTDCPDWDVRRLAAHVLGMAEMAASIRESLRQTRAARRRGGVFLHALTAVQVEERAQLSPGQIVERFVKVAPRAARGRRRTPGFLRRRALPEPQRVGGQIENWSLGFLVDVVLTRDTWMHRVDVARATGRNLTLTADHDGVLAADVAAEWAGRHGQPCTLTLTGRAGGTWTWGSGGSPLELDAVEFCRVLSGRGHGEGLLAVEVPF